MKKQKRVQGVKKEELKLPVSKTNIWINLVAMITAFIGLVLIRNFGRGLSNFESALLLILSYAVPLIAMEAFFLKTWKNKSTGLDFTKKKKRKLSRVVTKLAGLYLTLGIIGFLYWVFPEYHGSFYKSYHTLFKVGTIPFVILSCLYFYWLDPYMVKPEDGYWHMGSLLTQNRNSVDGKIIRNHLLGWFVKGFFLPLMFVYFNQKMGWMRFTDPGSIFNSFRTFYDFAYAALYGIDLWIAAVGYIFTSRLFDSHIRTAEPTLFGWFIALECYQPFWSMSSKYYLAYDSGKSWGYWFKQGTTSYAVWGSMILLLIAIYVWATLAFGLRFSNLTNRGILTNGPYRYCKHPAYVSKGLSWWLISMPFLSVVSPMEAVRHSLLLFGVNLIYFFRARTEEKHLSQDPDYIAYAEYMEQHGIFRWVGRLIPAIRFKPNALLNIGPSEQEQIPPKKRRSA